MKRELIKESKKWIKVLRNNGFRDPFQLIVDNSFISIVNKLCIPISSFISLFKSEPKFFMTKCTYQIHKKALISKTSNKEQKESESIDKSPSNQEKLAVSRNKKDFSGACEIINCQHETPSIECVYSYIKEDNPHHYILGTNNLFYLKKLRDSQKIPVLRVAKSLLKINCNSLSLEKKKVKDASADKGELKRLKKMFG